jgi:hypothetical protein
MADTTFQIGVTFDNSTAIAGLSQLNSTFQSTTSSVASMWTQASSTVTVALQNIGTEAEKTAGRTKEQIEKASSAVDKLGDLIGVKVPGDLTKMLAASETIGPVLEAAFAPLQIIAFIQFAVELADKIKTIAENLGGWTKEAKENYEALVRQNRAIVEFNEKLADGKRRLNEVGHSGSTLTKIQIENDRAHRAEIEKKIIAYGNEAAALHRLLEGTHAEKAADEYGQEIEIQVANSANLSSEEIEKFRKRLGELEGDAQHAKGAIREFWEEVQNSKQVEEEKKKRELAAQQLQEAIAAGEVRLNAEKNLAEKRIELEQSVVRNQLLAGKITLTEAANAEAKALDDRFNVQTQYLTKLRNLLAKDPEHSKDRLLEIKEQLKVVELDHQKAVLDLYNQTLEKRKELEKTLTAQLEQEHRKQEEDAAKEVDKAFQKIHQKVEEIKKIQGIYEESARQHDEAVGAMERSRLDFELQMGRISQKEHDKRLKEELQAETDAAIKKLRIKQALYAQDSEDYARLEAQIQKLHDKTALEIQKIDQTTALRQQKVWQDAAKGMSSAITGALNSWIQGSQTLSQAWTKMAEEMAMKFIQGLEKQMLAFIEAAITRDAVGRAESEKESLRNAIDAGGKAYKWAAAWGGPPAGAIAAAIAFSAVEAFGSAEGGQYLVPGDQLTMLHRNEMVLPAGVADRMRGVIEGGGGGGVSVIVHHSVNAVDAESFRTHIRKHGNMIGNEVARVLKKKGFAAR